LCRTLLSIAWAVRPHDADYTDVGVPVHVLRKIAGHGSLVTTQHYLHPDAQSIADAGIALSAHLTANWSPATAGEGTAKDGPRSHKYAR
jgi:hypothetical protein